jgi:putative transposase
MRKKGLCAARRKKLKATTDSKHRYHVAANMLGRNVSASAPEQAPVSDIT